MTYVHACVGAPDTCRPPGRAARWCSLASRAPTAQWFASSVVQPRTAPRITGAVRSSQPTSHTPILQAGETRRALPSVAGALRSPQTRLPVQETCVVERPRVGSSLDTRIYARCSTLCSCPAARRGERVPAAARAEAFGIGFWLTIFGIQEL